MTRFCQFGKGNNPSNQTLAIKALELRIDQLVNSTVTNSTSTDDIKDLQTQVTDLITQLNATRTNSTATDVLIDSLQDRIDILTDQLNAALTNSTATEAEIDVLQDTINSLTEDLENLEQDGIGAGALGTSGRMVSAVLDGYVIYGEHGKIGTVSEATTYNWYTGPVDYVGIIPNKDYFTQYYLDSPNGLYNVQNSELVPVPGSSKLVRTDGYKVLEGSAPVIQDRGREVEIDVNGKVLVQLDGSRLGNGVTVGVDTESVTAQVVTSPNDLINTEYRDFNGTGKFVLFEGEAQYGPLELRPYGSTVSCYTWNPGCNNIPPHVSATPYYGARSIQMYAEHQPATAQLTLDAYVSDVEKSLIHSNATLSATYGHSINRVSTVDTWRITGAYDVIPTFVDGLWHVTSLLTESEYSVETEQGTANGTVAAHGTYRVTDPTPYVVHGTVGPDSFEKHSDTDQFQRLRVIGGS